MEIGESDVFITGKTIEGMLLGLKSFIRISAELSEVPQQNLTSHAGWSRIISRKHTVLDQRPDLADMYIPGEWCFATENPDTKEFIKVLINELIEMFRNPPYLHCCCDKAFGFGSTEEDRTMSADVLFTKHISFLNTYLSERNIRMVMWADMIYSSMDALYWKCSEKTADYILKNVLINIWTHNNPGKNGRMHHSLKIKVLRLYIHHLLMKKVLKV